LAPVGQLIIVIGGASYRRATYEDKNNRE